MNSVAEQGIITKSIEFMNANLSRKIQIPEIAKAAYCSHSHLRRVFRQAVGHGIREHLLGLRMEKAKSLLRETNLSVTEIAAHAGVESPAHFTAQFHKREDLAPLAFRKAARSMREMPGMPSESAGEMSQKEWLRDDFEGPSLADWWKPDAGEWKIRDGVLHGQAPGGFSISLTRPLPENVRIAFQLQAAANPQGVPSPLLLALNNERDQGAYYRINIATFDNRLGQLRLRGSTVDSSKAAVVRTDGAWQTIEIEIKDDRIRVSIDGLQIMQYREPFPSSYADRCRFKIDNWAGVNRFRCFRVFNLGFNALTHPVRQGDSLFNSGLFDRAQDFYLRLLEAGMFDANTMELRFKVGLCFVRRDMVTQARAWLAKVVEAPGSEFWLRHARLGLLEADAASDDPADFIANARRLQPDQDQLNGIRVIAQRAAGRAASRGFHERALRCHELMAELEEPGSMTAIEAAAACADSLFKMARLAEASQKLRMVAESPATPDSVAVTNLHLLADALTRLGKFGESEQATEEIDRKGGIRFNRARNLVHKAFNAWGRRKGEQALGLLASVSRDFSDINDLAAYAEISSARMLCANGLADKAEKALQRAARIHPGSPMLRKGMASDTRLPLRLAKEEWRQAGQNLAEDMRRDDTRIALHAEQGVKAGILFELAGQPDKARSTWDETVRRFPLERCCYFAALAEDLQRNRMPDFKAMLYPEQNRCETMYLTGLLFEKRGKADLAKQCFQLAATESPWRYWPAVWAEKKLNH